MIYSNKSTQFSSSGSDAVLEQDGSLVIGATATFGSVFHHPAVRHFPALYMALRHLVAPMSRQKKSMGRVLCGDPEAQGAAAALMALDAQLILTSPRGERILSMLDYFGQEGSALGYNEVVRRFFVSSENRQKSVYQSVDYLRSGQAVCGVAVWVRCSQDIIEDIRIVLSGCIPFPVVLPHIADALRGHECTADRAEEATRKLGQERLLVYNPSLKLGSHLFNLAQTLIKRAVLTI